MAGSSSTALSVLSPPPSVPITGSSKTNPCETRVGVSMRRNPRSISFGFGAESQGKRGSTRLNAVGLTEIEPDINEDPKDRWATNGVSAVRFLQLLALYICVGFGMSVWLELFFPRK